MPRRVSVSFFLPFPLLSGKCLQIAERSGLGPMSVRAPEKKRSLGSISITLDFLTQIDLEFVRVFLKRRDR